MKNYLYTAREIIALFQSELNFKISEANFAKHKKAKIFKMYEKEGKKGDFYKFPEAAIDFFNQVNQRNEKGWTAIDKLNIFVAKYEKERKIIDAIEKQLDTINNPGEITFEMFKVDQLEDDYKEDDFKIFRCEISGQNDINSHMRYLSFSLCKELEKKYSSFQNHPLKLDMLKELAGWVIYPKEFAEGYDIDIIGD